MFDRVIVAFRKAEDRRGWKDITELLAADLVPSRRIAACRDAEAARQVWGLNTGGRDLMIVDCDLPASDDDPSEGSRVLGAAVGLVREMQATKTPPTCILVGGIDKKVDAEAIGWNLCYNLTEVDPRHADMAGDLMAIASQLAAKRDKVGVGPGPVVSAGPSWALLDVHLNGSQRSSFRLHTGQGARQEEPREYPLALDETEMRKVVDASRALRKKISEALRDRRSWENYVGKWSQEYEELGRSVFSLISRDKFQYCWALARTAANENVRLRFVLNEDSYDGLWESMFDPQEKWLMLQSTIARRTQAATTSFAHRLDGGDGQVHVLAIASNVPDNSQPVGMNNAGWDRFWGGFHGPIAEDFYRTNGRDPRLNEVFQPLNEIEAEMEVLRTLQHCVKARPRAAGLPPMLDLKELDSAKLKVGESLADKVRDELLGPARANGAARYDVVHFAGHALFNDGNKPHERGYLVFGSEPHTRMVPVAEFAGWLRQAGVQMVYLSCCRSSAARAAFEMAFAGIPLAIGFTWDLDSRLAVDFAKSFYEELFKNDLKVCKAFQSARRTLHTKYQGDDPIWTSPVLVAQPNDWPSVESYMAATA